MGYFLLGKELNWMIQQGECLHIQLLGTKERPPLEKLTTFRPGQIEHSQGLNTIQAWVECHQAQARITYYARKGQLPQNDSTGRKLPFLSLEEQMANRVL
jgi:hypothetical protein